MTNLKFGTLNFNNEKEYYVALGTFCNNKAFSVSYEPNKSTGLHLTIEVNISNNA